MTARVARLAIVALVATVLSTRSAAAGAEIVAELVTSEGTMVLALRPDVAPRHVENFVALARSGFYDGLTFHRVVPGFVVQAGCPEGDGTGGPGYTIEAEFNDLPHVRGTLSMARRAHVDSAGSQFFLCHADGPRLDGRYTVFGSILPDAADGLSALDAIAAVPTGPGDAPLEPVFIEQITIRNRRPGE